MIKVEFDTIISSDVTKVVNLPKLSTVISNDVN